MKIDCVSYKIIQQPLFVGIFIIGFSSLYATKPWHDHYYDSIYELYRNRLRERFVKVDSMVERQGVNIPAVEINRKNDQIDWGDANASLSHYLSLLATEYAWNKKQKQSNFVTIQELFYAMLALERLDLYSESYLRQKVNSTSLLIKYPDDFNGFHLRDDVSKTFWTEYQDHFSTKNFKSIFDVNRQGISQDNIIHNLEGLALVSCLVGKESVKEIPVFFDTDLIKRYLHEKSIWKNDTVDFSIWAADFTKRYLLLLQQDKTRRFPYSWLGIKTHWYLADPVWQQLVKEGSGEDLDLALFYHYGLLKAGETITGQNLRKYPGAIPFNNLVFDFLMKNRKITLPIINWKIPIEFDDYKLRSLATIGNPYGVNTYYYLIFYRNVSPVFKYEHFPLIWIVLHDPRKNVLRSLDRFTSEREYYRNLFLDIPPEGPNSNNTKFWRSTSRCVWPENLNKHWEEDSEFSGMDFLMLYNLYRLIFR